MSSSTPVHIIGAGGQAKVVISTLRAVGIAVAGIYDDNASLTGKTVAGVSVLGTLATLRALGRVPAIIAIGSNKVRKALSEALDLEWVSVVHPRAWVDPTAWIEPGTVVFAGAVIQPSARVGRHVIINTAATVDHDCEVANFAHVGPGVNLSGAVQVGEGAFMGTGSSTVPHIKIGAWALVGVGAGVARDVPFGVTVFGNPARVLQPTKTDPAPQ